MTVAFFVPGEPVAKGRARAFVRHGHVAHYTPEKTARYENLVKLAAQQAMAGEPLSGPLSLYCTFALCACLVLEKARGGLFKRL